MEVAFASATMVVAIAALPELPAARLWCGATSIHALISASVSFEALAAAVAAFSAATSVVLVRALDAFRELGPR